MKTLNRLAFTLVELLVVIGIIALLISILLPALSRAKEQGNRVACASNQRQIIAAIYMYGQDWKQKLPFSNWRSQEGTASTQFRGPGWLYDSQNGDITLAGMKNGAMWKYLKQESVYRCPFDLGPYTKGPAYALSSYGINGAINSFGKAPVPFYSTTKFKSTDIIIWEADELTDTFNDGANYPDQGISRRHGGGRNKGLAGDTKDSSVGSVVGTIGGTVETITIADFFRENTPTTSTTHSRIWINPLTANGH